MATFTKRKNSKGDIKYKAEIRIKGARHFSKTFDRLTDAKQWAQQYEEKLRRHASGLKSIERHTLSEAIERYRAEYLPSIKSKAVKCCIDWWEQELGHMFLDVIRPADLIKSRTKLLNEPKLGRCAKTGHATVPLYKADGAPKLRKPKTVQNYMDILSTLFNRAMNEWDWVDYNPFAKIKKLKANNERTRFLSDYYHLWPGENKLRHWDELTNGQKGEAVKKFPRAYELPRLMDALLSQQYAEKLRNNKPMWAYYLFVIQFCCGLRLSEATHLVWEENDIVEYPLVVADMRLGLLMLKETKRDATPRIKIISDEAMKVFKALYEERSFDSPLVFHSDDPAKPLKFDKRIQKAVREAELQDFRWHDLRHTTGSYLSMNGAGQREVMGALHHKSLKSSQRYQHLSIDHEHQVLNNLANTVLGQRQAPSRFRVPSEA